MLFGSESVADRDIGGSVLHLPVPCPIGSSTDRTAGANRRPTKLTEPTNQQRGSVFGMTHGSYPNRKKRVGS
ncbi:hypothetical protein N7491_004437 [Penicillium cf. griseofulvum]|uniref:Uncharacterized protein n=1 Tax=Penicillium cf. griseofulvum TaxID=2972120 RepID=A0A9W9J1V4_9EURO|nr:hypothetical protein N7472_007126 [Penicillium cf. griseofulvum]KAJ5422941.1 hypothetical protein N7445_011049 [Penicillium cf. griseofulvum]KAJ5433842.1 hypothetical protein N7491_004437 [Penicillium cf. griseofulvum]